MAPICLSFPFPVSILKGSHKEASDFSRPYSFRCNQSMTSPNRVLLISILYRKYKLSLLIFLKSQKQVELYNPDEEMSDLLMERQIKQYHFPWLGNILGYLPNISLLHNK